MANEWVDPNWIYEPLTNDLMFHMVFVENEKARRSLVSTLLNIPESEMIEVIVLNPIQYSDASDAKVTVLDLRLHLNGDRFVNIEMQVRRFGEWLNRTLVYSCRQINDQTNIAGFSYGNLEPVIHIAIMNHTLFPDHKRFFARYELRDREGYVYSDKLQFYVMDIKAIAEADPREREQGLTEWAAAFRAESWDQIRQIKNNGVQEAVNQMQTIMSSPEQRQAVWNRRMAQMDYDSQIADATAKGIAIGEARGEARGFANGEAQGISQGISKERARLLKSIGEQLRSKKMTRETAIVLSGLSGKEFDSALKKAMAEPAAEYDAN